MIDKELATLLYNLILRTLPNFKKPNLDKWSETIEKMRRIDKRTPEQITFLIKWAQNHDFWQPNILSTSKLRDKFDVLEAQAKRDNNNSLPKGVRIS